MLNIDLTYSKFLLSGTSIILFELFVCNVGLGHFMIEFWTQYKTILFLIIFFTFSSLWWTHSVRE